MDIDTIPQRLEELQRWLWGLLNQESSGNAIHHDRSKVAGHWGGGCIVLDGIRFLYNDATDACAPDHGIFGSP